MKPSRYAPRKTRLIAGLLLVCGAFSGNAPAQWIVEDPTAISKMVKEYIETAKRWKDQYEHYQQQLIKLKQLGFVASEFVDNFPERDADYGMEMACPGSTGGLPTSIGDAFQQLAPDMKGDVVVEQRKLCQRIVLAENAKYNETVYMLKTLIQRQRELQSVEWQRASVGTSQGALAANDNEIQRLLARTTMDMEFWQTRITAYDKYIESLKWDSDQLAKCAMRGCESGFKKLIGNVVQAAALKAALSVD
jgi:uncharacterized protein YukE